MYFINIYVHVNTSDDTLRFACKLYDEGKIIQNYGS